MAKRLGLPMFDSGIVGEGGGVDADGAGTLIAHESSWVNQNRNKGSKAKVEKLLLQALGGEKLIWAPGIKGGDVTDYHIDALARFAGPGKVLIQLPQKPDMDDPWVRADYEAYEILKSARDARGEKLAITVIPEPVNERVQSYDFVASYVNHYVCNSAVISAQFGDREADVEARDALAQAYPGREIVMLNVDELGKRGGGIHCATQQQPEANASQ
ncbi:MAG: agmatine deiminase family protein [Hyphomicrobiales bacterium]